MSLVAAFTSRLPAALAEQAPDEQALAGLVAAARVACPRVQLDAAAYLAALGARLDPGEPPGPQLERLRTADLYLAQACLLRDPAAVAQLDAVLTREVEIAWARIETPGADAADGKQRLRERLLVGSDGHEPALKEYSGRGDLRAWLKVVAVREALQLRRRLHRETPLPADDLQLLPATGDAELDRLKQLYRAEFQQAFLQAVAALSSRERNLLRSHFLDRLSIDELAPLFGVHRATAARWLAKARQQLHDTTVEKLGARLELAGGELESVMRLIRSELDVSVARALRSIPPDPDTEKGLR